MAPIDDVRRQLGTSIRRLVGGNDQTRPLPALDGLFGPGSATWDVHADAAMLVGGIRALLLQTLHPSTMAGVADHSDYRKDPLGRLQRTSNFVTATTFGSTADAERSIAVVRSIHDRVTGTTPDGVPYRANDPHLLQWVHVTEVDSFLRTKQRFGHSTLDSATADRYVAEMAEIARRLGVDAPPTTVASLDEVLRSYRPELKRTAQSRAAVRFLALPPLPIPVRAPYGILFAGAVSLLPNWARRRLLLPRLPLTEAVAVRPAALALTRVLEWGLTAA